MNSMQTLNVHHGMHNYQQHHNTSSSSSPSNNHTNSSSDHHHHHHQQHQQQPQPQQQATGADGSLSAWPSHYSPPDINKSMASSPTHANAAHNTTDINKTMSPTSLANATNNNTVSAAADSSDTQVSPGPLGSNSANHATTPLSSSAVAAVAVNGGGGGAFGYDQQYGAHNQQYQQHQPPASGEMAGYFMANQTSGLAAYDSFYQNSAMPSAGGDFAGYQQQQQQQQQQQHHQAGTLPSVLEFKATPRFHPYGGAGAVNHQPQQQTPAADAATRTAVSSSGLSPPPQQQQQQQLPPPGQPTPSPSPKQCDKCSFFCETSTELHTHYMDQHGGNNSGGCDANGATATNNGDYAAHAFNQQQQQQQSIKEESTTPSADILDLDSQKMVYPPSVNGGVQSQHGPLPSMHSLHPMHARGMMWGGHDAYHHHSSSMYPHQQQQQQHQMQLSHHQQQQQQQHQQQMHHHQQQQQHQHHLQHQSAGMHHQQPHPMQHHAMHPHHQSQHHQQPQMHMPIKEEFAGMQPTSTHLAHMQAAGGFGGNRTSNGNGSPHDVSTNNLHGQQQQQQQQSEFPTTTTPQELPAPFRAGGAIAAAAASTTAASANSTFEAATSSSLPTTTPAVAAKAGNWKSNEARRPKTYNCTACNKWFTSSGHLKRHYNTTLHKNAVKSSGIDDPAHKPTSMFHHPDRDQNKLHKINHGPGHVVQPPPQPPNRAPSSHQSPNGSDASASPDHYSAPYTPALGFPQGPQGGHHPQHMYQPHSKTSAVNHNNNTHAVHPNGQAGPSVPASQPRGLQFTMTNTTGTTNSISYNTNSSSSISCTSQHSELHQLQPDSAGPAGTPHHQPPLHLDQPAPMYQHMLLEPPQQQQSESMAYHSMEQQAYTISNTSTSSMPNNTSSITSTIQCPPFHTTPTITIQPLPLSQPPPVDHWAPAATQLAAGTDTLPITITTHTPLHTMRASTPSHSPFSSFTADTISPALHHQQQQQQQQLQQQQQQHLQQLELDLQLDLTGSHQQQEQPSPLQPAAGAEALPSIRSISGNHHYLGNNDGMYLDMEHSVPQAFVGTLPDTQSGLMRFGGDVEYASHNAVTHSVDDSCQSPDMPDDSAMHQQQQQQQHTAMLTDLDHHQSSMTQPSSGSDDKSPHQLSPALTESTPFNTPPHTPSVILFANNNNNNNHTAVYADNQTAVKPTDTQKSSRKPYQRRTKKTTAPGAHDDNITDTPNAGGESAAAAAGPPAKKARKSKSATNTAGSDLTDDPNDRREVCFICRKTFNRLCYLTQHNTSFHSGARPYKCDTCGKRFASYESCQEHRAKHVGNKPFKCEECPKQFNHKTDLRRHMCLHQGVKPHRCEECGKSFVRRDHKVKHVQTHARRAALAAEKENRQAGGGGGGARAAGVRPTATAAAAAAAASVGDGDDDDDDNVTDGESDGETVDDMSVDDDSPPCDEASESLSMLSASLASVSPRPTIARNLARI